MCKYLFCCTIEEYAILLLGALGGFAFSACVSQGLTLEQWLLSLLIGFVGLLFARIPQCFPRITRMFPEFGMREEDLSEKASLALGLRGRSPSRMNDRCMISTLAVAKKYARRAKVLTIRRMKPRRGAPRAGQPADIAITDAYLPVQVTA